MSWQKIIIREILFLFVLCTVSFLFWLVIAFITDQKVIAPEFLYLRERNAFFITIALVYFLRINILGSNEPKVS